MAYNIGNDTVINGGAGLEFTGLSESAYSASVPSTEIVVNPPRSMTGFATSIAVGSGLIVAGTPSYNGNAGIIDVFDLNGNWLSSYSGSGDDRLGLAVGITNGIIGATGRRTSASSTGGTPNRYIIFEKYQQGQPLTPKVDASSSINSGRYIIGDRGNFYLTVGTEEKMQTFTYASKSAVTSLVRYNDGFRVISANGDDEEYYTPSRSTTTSLVTGEIMISFGVGNNTIYYRGRRGTYMHDNDFRVVASRSHTASSQGTLPSQIEAKYGYAISVIDSTVTLMQVSGLDYNDVSGFNYLPTATSATPIDRQHFAVGFSGSSSVNFYNRGDSTLSWAGNSVGSITKTGVSGYGKLVKEGCNRLVVTADNSFYIYKLNETIDSYYENILSNYEASN